MKKCNFEYNDKSIDIYLESFYQEFIKKRSRLIKFVICQKLRKVIVCN